MTEQESNLLKSMVAMLLAVQKTLKESDFKEQYLINLAITNKDLHSRVGAEYLKSLFDQTADGEAPHEQ